MKKLLISLLIAVPVFAHANFYSGNDLLIKLNADDFHSQGMAAGYIVGVYDAVEGVFACSPSGVVVKQMRDIVKSWLDNNPSLRHKSADLLVTAALKEIWPCAAKKTGTSL